MLQKRRPKTQHIYLHHYLSGKSYKEIGAKLRVTESEVAHVINRGVKHLAAYGLPKNLSQAAQFLRRCGMPHRNILEAIAILLSDPDSNDVLDVISSIAGMSPDSDPPFFP